MRTYTRIRIRRQIHFITYVHFSLGGPADGAKSPFRKSLREASEYFLYFKFGYVNQILGKDNQHFFPDEIVLI